MSFLCHSCVLVSCMYYSYFIRMELVCTHMSSVCHSYALVLHPYVLVCGPYLGSMYSCVISMSLICTRTLSLCQSYVLIYHLYYTRMYLIVIGMLLVCGFTMNPWRFSLFHNKNDMKVFEGKKEWQKNIEKTYSTKKNIFSCLILYSKRFKRIKIFRNILTLVNLSLRCWFLWEQILFFSYFGLYCWQPHRTLFQIPSPKARVKFIYSPRLPFLVTCTSASKWFALISAS